jgi:integrase
MQIHRFTERFIDSIRPPQGGRSDYWETVTSGFGLRVSSSGRKTWVQMYRHHGRLRRFTLGTYSKALPLGTARKKALIAMRAVDGGGDPASLKLADRKAETFAELANEYLEHHAKQRKRSWRKDYLALKRDLLPAFANTKAKDINRREVHALLDKIVARGAPIQANRTLEILRKIFNWGITREIVETNPCHMIEKPSAEHQRERVLNDGELRALWSAFEREKPLMSAMFKLRLLTAQRGGEISSMRWSDIDAGWWTIPGEFTKNGRTHRVPLNQQVLNVLADIEQNANGSEWVFPSPTVDGPIKHVWKATGRIRRASGVDAVPHDLRRTVASRMTGDLGISRLMVSKILNHVETGVTAVYDRHSYDAEKRLALDAWGQQLDEILSSEVATAGANIVRLSAG